ncbi:hypothetical protein JTB14_003995 [Gonioctena quinquepunctata]|nr:hypothetical protein JTB14_003995 [Gonioctena quinquepunctata]
MTIPNHTLEIYEGSTPLTIGAASEYLGFIQVGTPEGNVPDVEFILVSPTGENSSSINLFNSNGEYATVQKNYNTVNDLNFFLIEPHPKSKGSISLSSNSAGYFPLINMPHFSDPDNEDIETMYKCVKFVLSLT